MTRSRHRSLTQAGARLFPHSDLKSIETDHCCVRVGLVITDEVKSKRAPRSRVGLLAHVGRSVVGPACWSCELLGAISVPAGVAIRPRTEKVISVEIVVFMALALELTARGYKQHLRARLTGIAG